MGVVTVNWPSWHEHTDHTGTVGGRHHFQRMMVAVVTLPNQTSTAPIHTHNSNYTHHWSFKTYILEVVVTDRSEKLLHLQAATSLYSLGNSVSYLTCLSVSWEESASIALRRLTFSDVLKLRSIVPEVETGGYLNLTSPPKLSTSSALQRDSWCLSKETT